MKNFLRLKNNEIISCIEEYTGRQLTARAVEVTDRSATLRIFSDGSLIKLGEQSDVTRKGHTIIFH
jgi:hypothetical protein